MKPGKVLCCMFLFAVLGVFTAQNVAKFKKRVCGLIQLNYPIEGLMFDVFRASLPFSAVFCASGNLRGLS